VSDTTTWVARILAIGYFGFLLVVLPVLGLVEKTKPIPASIADAVLAETKPAEAAAPQASR
jgi:ubiquinol-cytochrome c reductase cytochrome b subunit